MKSLGKQSKLKEKVFRSAWKIVESEGMDQLSVRGIAELSDCSLGDIYDVLDSFQDLQLRINANILSQIYLSIDKASSLAIKQNKPLKELLRDIGTAYIDFGQKNRFLWKALFEHAPSSHFPDWYIKHIHEGIDLLGTKIAYKYNLSELEARKTLGFFWASVHGICSILLNKKLDMVANFFNADIHLDPYIEYCLQGLFSNTTSDCKKG